MKQHWVSYVVFTLGLTALATARAQTGTMDVSSSQRDRAQELPITGLIGNEPPGTRPAFDRDIPDLPSGPPGPLAVPGPTPLTSP